MKIKEIQEFSEIRPKARAYFCFLMERNIPSGVPGITIDDLVTGMKKLSNEIKKLDAIYVLDPSGRQVTNTVSIDPRYARKGAGENRSNRAYYYRVIKERRCVLTDPYPSLGGNNLVVTSAYPVFDEKGNLIYIVCFDMTLDNVLEILHPSSIDSFSGKISKIVYAAFSMALFLVAMLLFIKGMDSFIRNGMNFEDLILRRLKKC